MIWPPPRSSRTDTRFPSKTLVRSIGLARDGRGVAKAVGDMFEHRVQRRWLGRVVKKSEGLDACRPGSEMLGAEFIAHRLADIGIHIVRSDRAQDRKSTRLNSSH